MTRSGTSRTSSDSTLQLFRIAALASLVALLWQFVTAGQLVSGNDLTTLHAIGAGAVHVTTGVTLVAAFLHWRRTRSDQPVLVGAAIVFVLTFVQAALGGTGNLAAHVPGALVITVGVVWLAVWGLRATR
jgi:heme A synthase